MRSACFGRISLRFRIRIRLNGGGGRCFRVRSRRSDFLNFDFVACLTDCFLGCRAARRRLDAAVDVWSLAFRATSSRRSSVYLSICRSACPTEASLRSSVYFSCSLFSRLHFLLFCRVTTSVCGRSPQLAAAYVRPAYVKLFVYESSL